MQITDEELASINRAIFIRYGMDFSNYEVTSFKRRVSRVIDKFGLESSLGLWRKLIGDQQFIYTFIDEITVGLTEMFRNHDLWIKLRRQILPDVSSRGNFSVWHAGCSTGEEVYSMAMLLMEENLIQRASLTATDLSSQAIASAKSGLFSTYYAANYALNYQAAQGRKSLDAYYEPAGEHMHFNKVALRNATFFQHNLVKDPVPGRFDLIFCRNVMIYFDEVLKIKVLQRFYEALADDGYFIIGYYDALPAGYKQYFISEDPQTKIFRKATVLQPVT